MIMKINPNILECKHLRIWYDAGGRSMINSTMNRSVRQGELFRLADFKLNSF